MKYTLTYTQIADAVMSLSALRGDITNRGYSLVDNDDYALCSIMESIVPALLDDNNIPYSRHKSGWRVGPTSLSHNQILRHVVQNVLYVITLNPAYLDTSFPSSDSHAFPISPHFS